MLYFSAKVFIVASPQYPRLACISLILPLLECVNIPVGRKHMLTQRPRTQNNLPGIEVDIISFRMVVVVGCNYSRKGA